MLSNEITIQVVDPIVAAKSLSVADGKIQAGIPMD